METIRLTKDIKNLISRFKEENHGKYFKNGEFKNQLFKYLNCHNKNILRKDVIRWCKNHPWILEEDEEPHYRPRKRINLPNRISNSYGKCIRRGRESTVDEGNLPTIECNESASLKREVETPGTSAQPQSSHHLPSEVRKSFVNEIGQLGYNSDASIKTVYRGGQLGYNSDASTKTVYRGGQLGYNSDASIKTVYRHRVEGRREIVRQSGLQLTQSLNEGQVEEAGAPLVPDSSGHTSSLSPQVSVLQTQPVFQPPPPSCSTKENFNQPPPDESNSDYDSRYLKSYHDAIVSVRSLTDLCLTCSYLRPGLLPLKEFTHLLSRINKKIAMPKTSREAFRAQFKQINQERIHSDLNRGTHTDSDSEVEILDNVIEME